MRILGIHYDRPYLRWSVVEQKGKKRVLQSLKSIANPSPEDVKQLYKAERKDSVATGLQAIVRHLDFKISSMKKIEKGLGFQIEALTPLPLNDLVYSAQTQIKGSGAQSTIFLASKSSLISDLDEWKKYSVDPDLTTAIPQSLVQFSKYCSPTESSLFLVHLGSEEWTCVWMDQGRVKKSFVIDGGIESILSALWEDRKKVLFQNEVKSVAKQIDLLQLKPNLNPHLFSCLKELRNKLSTVLYSFQHEAGFLPVFFTGRTDAFMQLRQFLLQTSSELSIFDPPLPIHLEELKSAIAIGSAIEALDGKKVQFLKGEFTPAKQWRRAGAWGISTLTASFILSCVFLGWGIYNVQLQKEMVANSTRKLVHRMDKTLSESLFADGIEIGVEKALRAVQKYDKEAPFLPQAPTVSEVLSWTYAHPILSNPEEGLEVIELKYQLVSFPKIGSMKDPYSAKVELEFKSKNSMGARRLHEELLKGDHLVDPSKEISWESLSETTRTAFYLKNRTPYVP